jgi:hypothetical protein
MLNSRSQTYQNIGVVSLDLVLNFVDFYARLVNQNSPPTSVNTAPERAKRLIGRVAEALSDRYTIIHVDNCESKHRETEDN